jgi:hypothetical protein
VEAVVDLWLEVLRRAVDDINLRYGADEMDQQDAKDWFYDWRVYTGSFLWICYSLNLDPSYVRKKLLDEARPLAQAPLRVQHSESVVINEHLWTATTLGASGEVTAA